MADLSDSRLIAARTNDDDKELEALGYVPSFKREFSNLATVRSSLLDDSGRYLFVAARFE